MTQFLIRSNKVSALLEQARAAGFSQSVLDAAMDEDDSKTAVAALLASGEADPTAPSAPPSAKKRKTTHTEVSDKESEASEAREESQEEWRVDRDDVAVWRFVKDNRDEWIEWLRSSRIASVGRDPSRHDTATLRRFWNSEHALPQKAFNKADESLLREIVSLPAMRDAFVEFLKIAPVKLSKTARYVLRIPQAHLTSESMEDEHKLCFLYQSIPWLTRIDRTDIGNLRKN